MSEGAWTPSKTALLVIDVQRGFDMLAAAGRRRNNPRAEERIASLVSTFRDVGAAVFHVRHASRNPDSPFRPGSPGFSARAEARERPGEPVLVKSVNSAFIGTDLEARLRAAGIDTLVIVGATTNHCVETTTRMAGNLGFDTYLVRDATWTFDRAGPDGDEHSAEDIHTMTLANVAGEFATVVSAEAVDAALRRASRYADLH